MHIVFLIFFFNDTATTEIYTLSLHDALPISDHAGVGRDEEDRRGEDPDVDLRRVEHVAVEAKMLDEPEHRIVPEAALVRREPEQRLVAVLRLLDRKRRQRDQRQREVDREYGARDPGER